MGKGFSFSLGEIISIMMNNSKIIKPKFKDYFFEVNYDEPGDSLDLYIPTKIYYKKFPVKSKRLEKIKELFNAKDILYVEKMSDDVGEYPFWAIKLR